MVSVLALAWALVTGCSRETAGVAVPADHDGPRPVTSVMLPELLLTAATIDDIMGAHGISIEAGGSTLFDSDEQFADRSCLGAWMPVQKAVYDRTEWTATLTQGLTDAYAEHVVIQAVTVFATRDAAQQFFSANARDWPPCGERTFTMNAGKYRGTTWTFDTVSNTDWTLWISQHQQDSEGWSCQRALRVSNNVAIDVLACKHYASDEAVTIVDGIDAQLPSV